MGQYGSDMTASRRLLSKADPRFPRSKSFGELLGHKKGIGLYPKPKKAGDADANKKPMHRLMKKVGLLKPRKNSKEKAELFSNMSRYPGAGPKKEGTGAKPQRRLKKTMEKINRD